MAGYDTVSLLTNSFVTSADVAYGVPSFWVRYFSPSPYTTINSSKSNAVSESRAAWVSGGHYMGIVSSPGHPAASQAQGQADAQTLASAADAYWLDVSSVYLPPHDALYC